VGKVVDFIFEMRGEVLEGLRILLDWAHGRRTQTGHAPLVALVAHRSQS
jgi:hypothetical protein